MHAPHAQFASQAKMCTEGQTINLLRSADTRMLGYFYAMYRGLRIRKALIATVASPKWAALKKKPVVNSAAEDVMCGKYWKTVYLLLCAVFPLLELLRINDSNIPGKDKLYYFTSQKIAAEKKNQRFSWR